QRPAKTPAAAAVGAAVLVAVAATSSDAPVIPRRRWRCIVPDSHPLPLVLPLEEQQPCAFGGEKRAQRVSNESNRTVHIRQRQVYVHVALAARGAEDAAELLAAECRLQRVLKGAAPIDHLAALDRGPVELQVAKGLTESAEPLPAECRGDCALRDVEARRRADIDAVPPRLD